jgi:hypothetical protein
MSLGAPCVAGVLSPQEPAFVLLGRVVCGCLLFTSLNRGSGFGFTDPTAMACEWLSVLPTQHGCIFWQLVSVVVAEPPIVVVGEAHFVTAHPSGISSAS